MFIEITGDTYGVGDIHGDTAVLQLLIKCHELNNCTLILLGDIGIWRYRDYKHYMALDALAAERNITIYAFRGNHDNPAFFNIDDKSSPIAVRFWNKFTNFKYIPDLSVVTINGKRGIVIGGGLSIDRCFRRTFQSSYRSYSNLYKKNDWWVNENLPNTNHINETYDFILSHTGPRPLKISPLGEHNCSFFKYDNALKNDVTAELQRIEEIQKQFNPKKWWFGHYHINDSFEYFNTRCIAVDINYLSLIAF